MLPFIKQNLSHRRLCSLNSKKYFSHITESTAMKKLLLMLPLLCASLTIYSQTVLLQTDSESSNKGTSAVRKINDNYLKGIQATWQFSGLSLHERNYDHQNYYYTNISDFGHLQERGKPALPVRYDLIALPQNGSISFTSKEGVYTDYSGYVVHPALLPATDRHGDPEPLFEIDSAFYKTDIFYPENICQIEGYITVRGTRLALVRICPVQYNPATATIRIHHSIHWEMNFAAADQFADFSANSPAYFEYFCNYVLNGTGIRQEYKKYQASSFKNNEPKPSGASYLIITHDNYRNAADTLAKWKSQLGYLTEVISRSSWTAAQIKTEITNRYQSYTPKPDYFVILGDVDLLPGEIHQDPSYGDNFQTDLYYACMDGGNDYMADMAFGRISVSSASQALSVVNKIIAYEKNPTLQQGFYNNGLICAQFQDDDNDTYEDRRFSLTGEDILNYMSSQQSFTINRVYKTSSSITPLFWNDGYYANSEPVPSYLRKPTFAWNGNKTDITNQINSSDGKLFVLHRDHGYVGGSGWATPEFLTSDINSLNNGNKLPIVFSINCHTGEYQLGECFAERFLRHSNGGAVGVFGAAYYSYSGYNDGLTIGFFDAIWANPGLIPNFTGSGDNPSGSPAAHAPIYRMGDVLNQGLTRMIQTWGNNIYTHELFHYFGDPAMRIWTQLPTPVTATHTDSIDCNDTQLSVYSSSCSDCIATLVVDGQLWGSTTLSGGSGTITFPPVGGIEALLTLSGQNYEPYIIEIPFRNQCLTARFNISANDLCTGSPLTFTDNSGGDIHQWNWNFGSGASPATSGTSGPHTVTYNTPGYKFITLTVSDSTTFSIYSDTIYIQQPCPFNSNANASVTIAACSGILYDNGGNGNYSANTNDTVVISPAGATSLLLHFSDFDVEAGDNGSCNYDKLFIYDGPNTASPLLGSFCNTPGYTPPAWLSCSSGKATIRFYADGSAQGRGYAIEFFCASPGAAPAAAFSASPVTDCNGEIQFTDASTNNPVSWQWDFGDGNTSSLQNPLHIYQADGTYDVTLTATNSNGNNSFTRTGYIQIDRPDAPFASDVMLCNASSATLSANGSGSIFWYDSITGGNLLHAGNTYITPVLSNTTSYYAESYAQMNLFAGPANNSIGAGGYYTSTSSHYMVFNAMQPLTLVSVLVYAETQANRTIVLANSSGTTIHDTVINIPAGSHRIYLNWPVNTGNQYRLVCATPNNRLYRNTGGASYPYSIPGLISITGHSFPSSPSNYYYFYDWEIGGPACSSPRTAVTVHINNAQPLASFSYNITGASVQFTNTSINAASSLWDFGDGNYSTLTHPLHQYTTDGTYTVSLTADNGCGSDVFYDTLYIYSTGYDMRDTELSFAVFPNPAGDIIYIHCHPGVSGEVSFRLFDITGRMVYSSEDHFDAEPFMHSIRTGNISDGIYILTINTINKKIITRVVISRN
jgi:PKD repeat protein